jgi:hypothetical protein
MPCLPSGRHVAIDAQPLGVLKDALVEDPYCLHTSDFRSNRAMFPWIRVLNLEPATTEAAPAYKIAAGSAEVAKNLVPRDSGLRLSDWPEKFQHWDAEDQAAFQQFIDGRGSTFLASCRTSVLALIEQHRSEFRSCVEFAWRKEGIHPDQELGEDELPARANLDAYDALVALGQCMQVLAPDEIGDRLRTPQAKVARMHAMSIWSLAQDLMDWPSRTLEPLTSTLANAAILRQRGKLHDLPAQSQTWWRDQLTVECELLYDAGEIEGLLMPAAPRAWALICTIAAKASLADLQALTARSDQGR